MSLGPGLSWYRNCIPYRLPLRIDTVMKTHRLAAGILGTVVVFVLLVAGTLIAKSRTAAVEPTGPAVSSADLRIKDAQIEEEAGGVRWGLTAEQVLIFDAEGRTALRRISVKVFEHDRSWTIVGAEGDLFHATRNIEIRNNLVVTSSDGLRPETNLPAWQSADLRLCTDRPEPLHPNERDH